MTTTDELWSHIRDDLLTARGVAFEDEFELNSANEEDEEFWFDFKDFQLSSDNSELACGFPKCGNQAPIEENSYT